MNDKFDELTKSLAQSVTRRGALKKCGLGLAGMALACLGLANKAEAAKGCKGFGENCTHNSQCCSGICNFIILDKGGKPYCTAWGESCEVMSRMLQRLPV